MIKIWYEKRFRSTGSCNFTYVFFKLWLRTLCLSSCCMFRTAEYVYFYNYILCMTLSNDSSSCRLLSCLLQKSFFEKTFWMMSHAIHLYTMKHYYLPRVYIVAQYLNKTLHLFQSLKLQRIEHHLWWYAQKSASLNSGLLVNYHSEKLRLFEFQAKLWRLWESLLWQDL